MGFIKKLCNYILYKFTSVLIFTPEGHKPMWHLTLTCQQ